jgi:AcrR family transcriptional regulator
MIQFPRQSNAGATDARQRHRPVSGESTSLREQRRDRARELSRNQILDAAELIFAEKGYHATTLKEVAELAEFSVGSVYTFFESKDDLYLQTFVRRGTEFLPGMRAAAVDGAGALAQLHALADFEVRFFREHPAFGRLVLRNTGMAANLEPTLDSVMRARFDESMGIEADVFRRGQASGELVPGDADVLARIFSGMVFAYSSTDPAVVDVDGADRERLPLDELHALIERAFGSPRPA